MRVAFVERETANHASALLCRVLEVSPSGYYAWRQRARSAHARADDVLTTRSTALHQASRAT